MATRSTLSIPTASVLAEESKPALRVSPNAPRPQPLKPHGFKSKFKEIFKSMNQEPGINIVSYSKKKASIPEPVKTAMAATNKAAYSESDLKQCWQEAFDSDSQTPTDSLPPSTPLSPSYKKHLTRKYTFSSVFSKGDTIKRKYVEPEYEFENWSYSEVSHRLPSVVTNTDTALYSQNTGEFEDDHYENEEQEVDDGEATTYFDESGDYVREGNAYIERFQGAHSPHSADTDSMHTIHNMAMLPLVDDPPKPPRSNTEQRRPSAGHIALLETYSDIMGELGDLVQGDESINLPRTRDDKVANLQDLLHQVKVNSTASGHQQQDQRGSDGVRHVPSTWSILKAYDSCSETGEETGEVPHEIVMEEYFIEHWVPAHGSSNSEDGNDSLSSGATTPRRRTSLTPIPAIHREADNDDGGSELNSSPRSGNPTLVETGTIENNSVAYSDIPAEFTGIAGEVMNSFSTKDTAVEDSASSDSGFDSGTENSGTTRRQQQEHLIISKVTKVVTLSRNNVVTNVHVQLEPLGKVEATPEKLLARESALNLRAAEKADKLKLKNAPLTKGDGGDDAMLTVSKPTKERRRSGLSQFLNNIMNHL